MWEIKQYKLALSSMLGTCRVLNTLVLSSSLLGVEAMTLSLNLQSLAQNKVLTNCLSTYSVSSPCQAVKTWITQTQSLPLKKFSG